MSDVDCVDHSDLVIEGLLTTSDSAGDVNLSPMGPRIDIPRKKMVLRPFKTSRSFANLIETKSGVFHITDDVNLIARAAVGSIDPWPQMVQIIDTDVYRLCDTCQWFLLELASIEQEGERATLQLNILKMGRVRDFIGFNRAKHAVIEAAILATRVGILSDSDITSQMEMLRSWVDKTGGVSEHDAYSFLQQFIIKKIESVNLTNSSLKNVSSQG